MKKCKECEFFTENKGNILRIPSLKGRAFRCKKYRQDIILKRVSDVDNLECVAE